MSSNHYEGFSTEALRTLAEGGVSRRPDVVAQRYLGLRYVNGEGVPQVLDHILGAKQKYVLRVGSKEAPINLRKELEI